jgi:glycosyltransferase involved in cell wall biosynthesis
MYMIRQVSLIIPSYNDNSKLIKLLTSIPNWEIIPSEIIVVDSSRSELLIPEDFIAFTEKLDINFLVIHKKNLYPGHARNIGINNAESDLVAFLDTSTYPTKKWLSAGLDKINNQKSDGVWGNTYYKADKFISKTFRACTYGAKPIRTFPGSILKKNIFHRCGLFVETARAGEDGDWMSRADLQNINISTPEEFLKYNKLNHESLSYLIKKWFRNYIYGAKLPYIRAHKDYYYYVISFIAVLFAFNWNRVFAAWNEESIFYIPSITKISLLLIIIIYIFIRGVYLPRKKGIDFSFIFPINFILIAFLSGFLDLTKALAFAYSRLKKE